GIVAARAAARRRRRRRRPGWHVPPAPARGRVMTDVRNPLPRLPHAAPFLLLDRVLEIGDRMGVFLKQVAASDPCVAADGTLPAAFLLEALAQGGGALLSALKDDELPQPGSLAWGRAFHTL